MKNEKNQSPKIVRPRSRRAAPVKPPSAPKATIRNRTPRTPRTPPGTFLTVYPPSPLFFLFDVNNIVIDDPLFKDVPFIEGQDYYQNEPIHWLLSQEKECKDLIFERLENFWKNSIFSGTAFLHKATPQTLNIIQRNPFDNEFRELSDVGLMPPHSELYISLDASLILNVVCRCRADCLYESTSLLFNKSSLSAQYITYSPLLIELATQLQHMRMR